LALKNLVREEGSRHGQRVWSLRTPGNESVHAFGVFCRKNGDYSPRTQKRYAEAVSRFLDYLYEAQVFGHEPVTARHLNDVVEAYVLLLRDGSAMTAARVRKHAKASPEDIWLAEVAEALNWSPIRPNSFSNTLAAINRFLLVCESLSLEAYDHARLFGIEHQGQYARLFKALEKSVAIPQREITQMRQNSMLGGVAKFSAKGLKRPQRLVASTRSTQSDQKRLDFPLSYVSALIIAATSWRDKALWLLLAASGIRTSEARNLLFEDIDFDEQQVYVLDPSGRRYEPPRSVIDQPRFKGRAIALTYLFPPLRQAFFQALEQYLRHEYVPITKPGEARYLFQYIEPTRRGQPLVNASDTAMAKSFKKAVKQANVAMPSNGKDWAPHSLRHLYGVYMLNDYPVAPERGLFGLELVEVQMLMGHTNIRSTQHYARAKHHRLAAKLKTSDETLLGLTVEEKSLLPLGVVKRLESIQ
jgi:integrase